MARQGKAAAGRPRGRASGAAGSVRPLAAKRATDSVWRADGEAQASGRVVQQQHEKMSFSRKDSRAKPKSNGTEQEGRLGPPGRPGKKPSSSPWRGAEKPAVAVRHRSKGEGPRNRREGSTSSPSPSALSPFFILPSDGLLRRSAGLLFCSGAHGAHCGSVRKDIQKRNLLFFLSALIPIARIVFASPSRA